MKNSNRGLNLAFGIIVVLLAGVAAVSMYLNRDLPVVRDAPAPSFPADARLPEGHPPIDASNQIATLEQISRSDPGNADVRIQIGNAYYDMGQYLKAAQAYEESLKLRPANPGVETDLATCYHELREYDKALAILDRVLRYQPSFAQALFNKGIVLQVGKKDLKGAIAAWENLLASNPNYPQRAEVEQKINQMKAVAR